MEIEVESSKVEGGGDTSPGCSGYAGMVHSKKVIKHALRQQAKRRRKNTTIASGNSRTLPRIVVKPLAPPPPNDPPSPPVPQVQLVSAGKNLFYIPQPFRHCPSILEPTQTSKNRFHFQLWEFLTKIFHQIATFSGPGTKNAFFLPLNYELG